MLSLPSVIEACRELGFEGKNLIAMQGPFSEEMNRAMLRQYDCRYLVTKDSGKAGGFPEKIQAAISCGAVPVIIGRPSGDTGISPGACRRMLAEKFGFTYRPHVTLLGIGMGSRETLTIQGKETVEKADLIIGARRMADAVRLSHQDVFMSTEAVRLHSTLQNIRNMRGLLLLFPATWDFTVEQKSFLTFWEQTQR